MQMMHYASLEDASFHIRDTPSVSSIVKYVACAIKHWYTERTRAGQTAGALSYRTSRQV